VSVESYRREGCYILPGGTDGVYSWCRRCGEAGSSSREGLVASLPAVRAFERDQARIRIHAGRDVETAGRPAVVTWIESMTSSDRMDVVSDAETCRIIDIHRGSALAPTIE
jgi:hypothetical protein